MDIQEEEKLVRAAKKIRKGPNHPFGKLYEEHAQKIRRYFLARLNDETAADDLASKTFEKALNGLDSFRWQGVPFSAWLFKIARNTYFDHLRSKKGRSQVNLEKAGPLQGDFPNQFEELVGEEEEDWLSQALLTISPREREIVYLKFYEGLTNRAIAKLTKLSETNVGTILYRTIRKLRKELTSTE
ncbi:MAG: sigma-70 family RNA polymerase sigma factor [Patescibacteria group bacterium]|nr:MAG: sigma-70 family RNA polymerase sigma factor [Patescibacteria group bacterium]